VNDNHGDGDLVARRFLLDAGPAIDPFGLAGPTGRLVIHTARVLVGLGTALELPLPDGLDSVGDIDTVTRRLGAITMDDRSTCAHSGLIAFGTLPFDRSAGALLSVPELLYGREADGTEWLTVVSGDPGTLPTSASGLRDSLLQRVASHTGGADREWVHPTVVPLTSDGGFRSMVVDALAAIDDGIVEKVVLARQVEVTMEHEIDIVELLRRWHALEPGCTVFSLPSPDGQFVGASPELLVERSGRTVHARPLAGTTNLSDPADPSGRRGDPAPATSATAATTDALPRELLSSEKDGREHHLVVEAIAASLEPLCVELDVPTAPDLIHLHNITHLGTSMTGTLRADSRARLPSALHLVAALHPTPAVGGVGRAPARALISRLESHARRQYAGPVGYVDADGDGRWMVGIRSVSVAGDTARMAAGVGIVRGSRPDTELRETDLKLTAVFDALAPGVPFSTAEHQNQPESVT
jgi:isochorismate synthase